MHSGSLEHLGREILRAVTSEGETAEVFLKRTWWRQAVRRNGSLRTNSSGMETGSGIRVFLGDGRWAHVHCTDLAAGAIREAVGRARTLAAFGEPTATRPVLPTTPWIAEEHDFPAPAEDGREFLEEVEEEIRRADAPDGSVPLAICADGITRVWMGNSLGFEGTYFRGLRHIVLGIHYPGGGGISYYRRAAAAPGKLSAGEVAEEAVMRTALPLRTPSFRNGRLPIVLAPGAASELIRLLHPLFIGGNCIFPEGEKIGSPELDLIDDGTLAGGIGTVPFDGEGWKTNRKILVREGIVEGTISGAGSDNGTGKDSRGNRVRDSYREPPVIGPTNLFVPEGDLDPGRVAAEVGKGIWVLNWESLAADPFLADRFSLRFSGCTIDKGECGGGIRSGFLTGEWSLLLEGISGRGTDLRFYPIEGSFGSPTLVIEGLEVGR